MRGTFRAAVEARDLAAIARTLDPDIELHSPVVVRPYRGRDAVVRLLRVLMEIFEDFHYIDELVSIAPSAPDGPPPGHALIFRARAGGTRVQGVDLLRFGDDGLVTELTVMVRPLPAAMTLARLVGRRLERPAASAR
ncbi:membrane protein [Actinomadura rubrobrunea]|uniref:Membrane protein n=1 Tax=Actinomadura rubrobrunea TaxID=115335 RepID=A0A9W6PUC4_9ACTN|nr:nuclear transport factor 2 family protein [Actinomadura rubrobrunea]GLW63371.1 membrane protein [Actinomadura rubrobrunea]